jgi:hypothetical protein
MSAADIADNKWEAQAAKPPVGSINGIMQMLLMGGFMVFFVWIVIFSVIAIVTPAKEGGGLAGDFENMKSQGTKPAEAAE